MCVTVGEIAGNGGDSDRQLVEDIHRMLQSYLIQISNISVLN